MVACHTPIYHRPPADRSGPSRRRPTRGFTAKSGSRNSRVRSCCGWSKNGCGLVHLDDLAGVHEHHPVRDLAREAHLVAHHQHGHAVHGELDHGVEHLLDHFRVERGGDLVEQHDLRAACRARARSRPAAAGRRRAAPGICSPARGCARARDSARASSSAAFLGILRTQIGASVQFSSTVRCGNRLNCWNTMPTSRRTSSIFLRSSVSSMPSTTTRPRCQLSSRLMQRSSVDLPLPDGPQITMRSPRMTLRSMSRSTWKSPNHLLKPAISTATGFRVVRHVGRAARAGTVGCDCPRSMMPEAALNSAGRYRAAAP